MPTFRQSVVIILDKSGSFRRFCPRLGVGRFRAGLELASAPEHPPLLVEWVQEPQPELARGPVPGHAIQSGRWHRRPRLVRLRPQGLWQQPVCFSTADLHYRELARTPRTDCLTVPARAPAISGVQPQLPDSEPLDRACVPSPGSPGENVLRRGSLSELARI